MLIKSEPTSTNSSPVCGNCGAEERRLLHQVRHRSVFRRLCTSCVLRLHPQAFCPTCFQLYPPTPPNDVVRTCVKCYSHSHSHCAGAGAAPAPYVCPLCVAPGAPIFKLKPAKDDNCRVMDRDAAKMLLAAAKIASSSMNKAAVAAKAEAERRVRDAAGARKKAKEALEHVAHLVIKEKARRKEGGLGIHHFTPPPPPPPKMATGIPANVVSVAVDRDNSNRVLAALNAVELRESEKLGVPAQGEGSVVAQMGDNHAPMDVDVDVDDAQMRLNAGSTTDMETDAGNGNNHGEKLGGVMNNEMVLVNKKENHDGVNGAPV